jgi:hypothetical protein
LGVPYEIVIRFRRAVSRRYLVNGLAVQHKRHRDVATHTKLLDSRRLGRSAEGKIDRCAEAGANDRNLPPGNRLFNRSIAGVRAEYSLGEDCQAGAFRQQLQRWLRNKLQGRQCPLGWMQS